MTAAERVRQLEGWIELLRLVIGRDARDATRIEQVQAEMAKALEEAKREAFAYEAVGAHIARALGDSDK